MNYIELINGFWLIDEQKGFTLSETRLYFFLLHLANRHFWKTQWLEYGDDKMQVAVGISADVLRTARKTLKKAKLIDFAIGGQAYRVRTRYQILTPNPNPSPDPNANSTPDPNANPVPDPLHYSKTKTNTKTKYNSEFSKISKNERFSKREYIASESDFD